MMIWVKALRGSPGGSFARYGDDDRPAAGGVHRFGMGGGIFMCLAGFYYVGMIGGVP